MLAHLRPRARRARAHGITLSTAQYAALHELGIPGADVKLVSLPRLRDRVPFDAVDLRSACSSTSRRPSRPIRAAVDVIAATSRACTGGRAQAELRAQTVMREPRPAATGKDPSSTLAWVGRDLPGGDFAAPRGASSRRCRRTGSSSSCARGAPTTRDVRRPGASASSRERASVRAVRRPALRALRALPARRGEELREGYRRSASFACAGHVTREEQTMSDVSELGSV